MVGGGLDLYTHATSPLHAARQALNRINKANGTVLAGRSNFGEDAWITPPQTFNIPDLWKLNNA